MASAPIHSLIRRRWRAAAVACFILMPYVLIFAYRTSLCQWLTEPPPSQLIVPGPALRAELAAMLDEYDPDGYGVEHLDIENYDNGIEVAHSSRYPEMDFYFTAKQELLDASGGPSFDAFYHPVISMPVHLYESLVKKDSASGSSPVVPDLVPSADTATAFAAHPIVPGPALRADLAAMLEEYDEDGNKVEKAENVDIENYDVEVAYPCRSPQVPFYFSLKQELVDAAGRPAVGKFYHVRTSLPVRRYENLVKWDSESGNQPPAPDLVASSEAATALALKKLDAEGVSVSGRERTVKSTDSFWILEYRFPEGKKPLPNDKDAETGVIAVAVSRKSGNVLVFKRDR